MIRAVLFDVDGTLVDTVDLHAKAWQEAFRRFGIDLPFERIRGQIGKGGDNLTPSLAPEIEEEKRQELQDYRSLLFQRDYLPQATPFKGVRELFERLYADGAAIVLASSAKRPELEYHLSLIGAADLVADSTSQDDVESSKPCPDIFETARAKAGTKKEETVVVGDSPWDIKAACRAGLVAIGVRCGGFPEEDLRGSGARAVFDGPDSLAEAWPGWLSGQPPAGSE